LPGSPRRRFLFAAGGALALFFVCAFRIALLHLTLERAPDLHDWIHAEAGAVAAALSAAVLFYVAAARPAGERPA